MRTLIHALMRSVRWLRNPRLLPQGGQSVSDELYFEQMKGLV
jgi:hypothetical protein